MKLENIINKYLTEEKVLKIYNEKFVKNWLENADTKDLETLIDLIEGDINIYYKVPYVDADNYDEFKKILYDKFQKVIDEIKKFYNDKSTIKKVLTIYKVMCNEFYKWGKKNKDR